MVAVIISVLTRCSRWLLDGRFTLSILEMGQAVEIKYSVIEFKCSANAALWRLITVLED